MSDVVIQVDHLWKKYRLGVLGTGTLRHDFNRWLHRTLGKPDPYAVVGGATRPRDNKTTGQQSSSPVVSNPSVNSPSVDGPVVQSSSGPSSSLRDDEMWALRDVSFEVKQGEILGIIGRNGAGKSTLLKILSRVTAPSSGEVRVKGRIASLLEVGTGFHPELTGRENIFLNGAILGMTKAEIKGKLDEIVAFAEVEKFIDTPVKRYSSGMYVRLAFAVAAHLDPEILIVDEVLAVGDAQFQKKCLGKMGEVAKCGRTVLFVSHQMAAVQNLCQSCLRLDAGRLDQAGATEQVIRAYLDTSRNLAAEPLKQRQDRRGNGLLRFTGVRTESVGAEPHSFWLSGQPGRLILKFDNPGRVELKTLHVSVGIDDPSGHRILLLSSDLGRGLSERVPARMNSVEISLDCVPLAPGLYGFTLYSTVQGELADWIQNAGMLAVEEGDFFGNGRVIPRGQGHFLAAHRFAVYDDSTTPNVQLDNLLPPAA